MVANYTKDIAVSTSERTFLSSCYRTVAVYKHFFARELLLMRQEFFGKFVDAIIWPVIMAVIFGYVLPHVGFPANYGGFMMVSSIVAVGFYYTCEYAFMLCQDLDGVRTIDNYLILPFSHRTIVLRAGIMLSFNSFVLSTPLIFVSKLFMLDKLPFNNFNLVAFVPLLALMNAVFGLFFLWLVGMVKSEFFIHTRIRVVDPLFMFGCFMYSWQTLDMVMPTFAIAILFNPVTYAMEALRACVLGPSGSMSLMTTTVALAAFAVLFGFLAQRSLKKRLDYVPV